MKKIFFLLLLLSNLNTATYLHENCASINKVTYRLSGGRFGDNLLAYMHAKWVSYRYGMPLIYYDFPYADELLLEQYEEKKEPLYFNQKFLNQRDNIDLFIESSGDQTLFIIPYFPESAYELSVDPSFSYFKVDWEDTEFKELLIKTVAPKKERQKILLPSDKISVALHIRRGPGFDGGFDSLLTTKRGFPLKFPSIHFYKDAIARLYSVLKKPLYIHLFTDDIDPLSLLTQFKNEFESFDIEWGCREINNHWTTNVLDDFFALTQFDCSIHGESNIPFCASKISHYQIEIIPESFHWEEQEPIIDTVIVQGENSKIITAYKEILCIK